ncbi:MAG TPA: copper amine oxidase N-terminal domain-containing protein [Candidatus Deferrimicrobium sp.]|nr:copper amine oxidase N-terminal domain-containing protein [Candidatus Deferrimicrobium sp.]
MRRSCSCGILRLVAFLAVCTMIAAGIVAPMASAQSNAGFVTLKTFPAAVTAIGMLGGATPTVVVATQNAGIYSMSGTSTVFRKLPAQLDLMRITSVAVLEPDRWLIGTDGDGLWLVKGEGTSFDRVTTLGCTRVARIVQDLRDPDALFIASLCTGLNYSTDRGVSWKSVGEGIASSLVTDVMRMNGDRIAVSSQDAGVFVSANNGTSYVKTPCPLMNVSSLAWDAATRTLFAAGGSGVAMTTDAGAHWANLPSPGTVTSLVVLPAGTVLVGTAERGVLRWNSSAKAWWDVAQGAGVTSALTMTCSATTLLVGGTTGALVRVDLSAPVAAVGPAALDLGSIPVNQARSATFAITNLGAGALDWSLENVPGYVTVTPQTGTGNGAVTVRVEGDSLSKGPHQSLLKVVTNGGDQVVTLRFNIAAAASVRIVLTVGKLVAMVGGGTVMLDAAPYIDMASGRTMVPIRAIVEALGGSVTWKAASRNIMIQLGTTSIVLRIGAMSATVDGVAKPLTVPATILGGRTMVPVRFVAENLGCTVGWNALARTVTITRQG